MKIVFFDEVDFFIAMFLLMVRVVLSFISLLSVQLFLGA